MYSCGCALGSAWLQMSNYSCACIFSERLNGHHTAHTAGLVPKPLHLSTEGIQASLQPYNPWSLRSYLEREGGLDSATSCENVSPYEIL